MSLSLKNIQQWLKERHIDGWLLYDFQGNNPLCHAVLGIAKDTHLTRRFFYWIPAKGEPIKIVHAIESQILDGLPGKKLPYLKWETLRENLAQVLKGMKKVAMEYSPLAAIPSISKVDAGTIDLVRSFGVEVVSSGPFLQKQTSVWDDAKLRSHLEAMQFIQDLLKKAWARLANEPLTEYALQQWLLEEIDQAGYMTDWAPICAYGSASGNPHYSPAKKESPLPQKGDLILIDFGCKKKSPKSVYVDITRVAVYGKKPSPRQKAIFELVREARDAAITFLDAQLKRGKVVTGAEVDRVCRSVIERGGYGDYFIHRTGHNIDEEVHGPGAHLDSLETKDDRPLIEGTCFSMEPGIYLPGEFGIRLEDDLFITQERQLLVTSHLQLELLQLQC